MLKQTIEIPKNPNYSTFYNNSNEEEKKCNVKTEKETLCDLEMRSKIKKEYDVNDFDKIYNDELILPHDPSLMVNISIPSGVRLQTPTALKCHSFLETNHNNTEDKMETELSNCVSYSLLSSDDEAVIDALPTCTAGRDPLECHEESIIIDNSSNNKQIIKTATATLHISKNITVRRITCSNNNFNLEKEKNKKVTESRSKLTTKWKHESHRALALASTPQSNFLDAIDLRPIVPTLNRLSKTNPNLQTTPSSNLSNPEPLNATYQYNWLQEFVKQFVDPKLTPSQVCFLLLQKVFSYKEYHRIKTLRNDISIKGSMFSSANEHPQDLDRISNLKRLQQQLHDELRRSFLYRHQLTEQGEQFWQITTSNMNASRTLSKARILITHRLTGAVTLKTHNYSFEVDQTKRQLKYQNLNIYDNGLESLMAGSNRTEQNCNYRAMQGYNNYKERVVKEEKEEEYKPPYKIRQESLLQDQQLPGSDESSGKRSLRVRTKRHYDENFTYDDEILMNYWEDTFEDTIKNKTNSFKITKKEWKHSKKTPSVVPTSYIKNDNRKNANNSSITRNCISSTQKLTNPKNVLKNENDYRYQHISRGSHNNQWPLNIDRGIHTNCASKDMCVICKKTVSCVVQHYVNAHRGAEVYVSRLSEGQIQYLRNNNQDNNPFKNVTRLNVYKNGQIQYETMCVFCLKTPSFMLNYWYKHFTIHTGEYAYRCVDCGVRKPTRYLLNQHHDQERQGSSTNRSSIGINKEESINELNAYCYYHNANIVQDYNFDSKVKEIVAYLCTLCNYIQMQRKNILKHLYTQHHIKCILPQHTEKLILLKIPDGHQVTDSKGLAREKFQMHENPAFFLESSENLISNKNKNKGIENKAKIATINLDDSSDSSRESAEPLIDTSHNPDNQNGREDSYMDQESIDYGDDLSYMICGMLDVEIITK